MSSTAGTSTYRVVWTRGRGCRELAELLCDAEPSRVQGDPVAACVTERADLLVARRFQTSFDLVDVAVPVDVEPDGVEAVVAAVAGGPHSALAARLAQRLGDALSVPASMVAAYDSRQGATGAEEVVEQIYPTVPELEYRTMEADDMSDLVSRLPARSLLVFGAPGGGWIRRHVSGPGAQLRSKASVGVVMVRSAPRRVFQVMEEPVFVAPMMHARDTLRIRSESTLAVAEGGRLVGLVRRSRLSELEPDTPVGQAMEEPVSISHTAAVAEAAPLLPLFGEDPVPVVDDPTRHGGGLSDPPAGRLAPPTR